MEGKELDAMKAGTMDITLITPEGKALGVRMEIEPGVDITSEYFRIHSLTPAMIQIKRLALDAKGAGPGRPRKIAPGDVIAMDAVYAENPPDGSGPRLTLDEWRDAKSGPSPETMERIEATDAAFNGLSDTLDMWAKVDAIVAATEAKHGILIPSARKALRLRMYARLTKP